MFFDRHLPVRLPRPPRPCRGASRGPRPARKSIQPENLFFVYPLCFDILPNSFALTKISTLLFSCNSELFAKNTRGGGTLSRLRSRVIPPVSRPSLRPIASPRPWCHN